VSEVLLLGTGGWSWPNPFCRCASCAWARDANEIRTQASALVDRTVLLDCGPDVPSAAVRHGVPLDGVRLLLLTHAHADHVSPQVLMLRHWARRDEPLVVAGPPNAIALHEHWVDPDGPVTLTTLLPGDTVSAGGYAARALPAAHGDVVTGVCVLYDLTTPDGTTLLYATDTGPFTGAMLDAVAGRAYDLVLLEETFGDWPGGDAHGHLGLREFGETVAALRRNGAVTARTRVVATHLGDHNPPGPELARRLTAFGAELHPDGTTLAFPSARPEPPGPQRVLILGGARSGKSVEAERRLLAEPDVVYVATARPDAEGADPEWAGRVARHRARRPAAWRTVETLDLLPLLRTDGPPLLVDCLTLWLAACYDDETRADALVAALRTTRRRLVVVSNEVGSGVVPATASGRAFRDALGRLNAAVAAECDEVWLTVAGIPQRLR
jgi:adenosylcobinamide kinase/adenosylcobinamide-phosphate guanylyltransferase